MATTRQWLTGCGIGCGVLLIATILIGVGGFLTLKRTVHGLDETRAATEVLIDRLGGPGDYVPAPDGAVPTDRLEAFLAVREALAGPGAELETTLESLDRRRSGFRLTPASIFRALRAASGLLPQGKRFVDARNEALLDAGMGLGEYIYVYTLAYYVWLGKSPASGPGYRLFGDGEDDDAFAVRESRLRRTLGYLNGVTAGMLRRQRRELEDAGAFRGDVAWSEALDAEIAALADDRWRLPWADGLPPAIEASLAPYRARLEAAWLPLANSVEWGVHYGER